jgi:hypothetical protein
MTTAGVRSSSRFTAIHTFTLAVLTAALPSTPAAAGDAAAAGRPPRSEAEVAAELARAPEVWLRPPGDTARLFKDRASDGSDHPVLALFDRRLDLRGLPVRRAGECQLAPDAARALGRRSRELRSAFGTLAGIRTAEPAVWRIAVRRILGKIDPAADGALMLQMLQCEKESMRELLVEHLGRGRGPALSQALAQRALYEPWPGLRRAAVAALAERPPDEVRPALLDGFRHPWPAAADHAVDALTALDDRDAVPALVRLLDAPDPAAPFPDADGRPVVREVVRINHFRNCQLCHAPSYDRADPARAAVPAPDQPLPPPVSTAYYAPRSPGEFVRADVTYLRQDFSLALPVVNPGPWPKTQRFDFFVRTRPADPADPAGGGLYPQREAVLRALRHLTGQDFGDQAEGWRAGLRGDPRWVQ